MAEWFYCPHCDWEFSDPYAEEHDGEMFGKCGECGNNITKPVAES